MAEQICPKCGCSISGGGMKKVVWFTAVSPVPAAPFASAVAVIRKVPICRMRRQQKGEGSRVKSC